MKRLISYAIMRSDGPYTETMLGYEPVCFMAREGMLWVKYRDRTWNTGIPVYATRTAREFGREVFYIVKDENNLKNILQNT